MTTPGIVTHYARDAQTGAVFPVQFFDDGSGNLIDDVPASNATAMTVGTTYTPGRQFMVNATVAGSVTVKFVGGGTLTISVQVGLTLLPWQVVEVVSATATATYANLV